MGSNLEKTLKQKAKTPLEIEKYVKEWRETFRKGAMGNHRAYAEARDTRHFIEEEKWIPEDVVLKILAVHREKLEELADMLKTRPETLRKFIKKDGEYVAEGEKWVNPEKTAKWLEEYEKKFELFGVESVKPTKKEI